MRAGHILYPHKSSIRVHLLSLESRKSEESEGGCLSLPASQQHYCLSPALHCTALPRYTALLHRIAIDHISSSKAKRGLEAPTITTNKPAPSSSPFV